MSFSFQTPPMRLPDASIAGLDGRTRKKFRPWEKSLFFSKPLHRLFIADIMASKKSRANPKQGEITMNTRLE
ncbi:MAG: hypothetical protein RR350_09745, partial [Oscillibacter sp.]